MLGFRKSKGKWALALLIALATPATAQTVRIHQGTLRGTQDPTIASYKGIPYAAPPVGNLRFQPPAPAPTWAGTRDASAYGHPCIQPPSSPTSVYYGGLAA